MIGIAEEMCWHLHKWSAKITVAACIIGDSACAAWGRVICHSGVIVVLPASNSASESALGVFLFFFLAAASS